MKTFRSIRSAHKHIKELKRRNKTIGFVPTMGALHEGHLSLVRRCKKHNDITCVSIFVNPKQFGPAEDYKKYPRKQKKDKLLLKKENVDLIIYPSVEEMYSESFLTYVEVNGLADKLCGESRPGHFKGVCTVVAKLLNITLPDRMYLGQKDAQQAIIIKRMIRDLNFDTRLIICPTVRESSGLAMSSRNAYLSDRHLKEAPNLYRSLKLAHTSIRNGERSSKKVITAIKKFISSNTSGSIDYVACVNADTLEPQRNIKGATLIALAATFGKARLIDNILIHVK